MDIKTKRLELRASLDIEGERMSLGLWRASNNKIVVRIDSEAGGLVAIANTTDELEEFLKKSATFIRKAQE